MTTSTRARRSEAARARGPGSAWHESFIRPGPSRRSRTVTSDRSDIEACRARMGGASVVTLLLGLAACASSGGNSAGPDVDASAPQDGGTLDSSPPTSDSATPSVDAASDGASWLDAAEGAADSGAQGDDGGSCADGTGQCGGQQPQTCIQGIWQSSGPPCPYVCSAGACTGSCAPGAQQCAGTTPQTCTLTGAWQSGTACPYTCAAGVCAGSCSPSATEPCATCGATGTATCSAGYSWGACAPPAGLCSFVDQSCAATCDTLSACWVGVDRSYDASTGEHFYTTSNSEAACCGFTVEAYDYYFLYTAQQSGLTPFYRCLLASGFHFYTTSSTCEGAAGATNEGSLGWIATSASCGSVALYRLVAANGDHLYTISSAEVSSAQASGYTLEGVAGYVWTTPEG